MNARALRNIHAGDGETKQKQPDRDPSVTKMEDEHQRVAARPQAAPARKAKCLRSGREDEHEAGEPVVGER